MTFEVLIQFIWVRDDIHELKGKQVSTYQYLKQELI